jgi:hypothetical protein
MLMFLRICSSELLRCKVTKTNLAYVPMPASSHTYALEPHAQLSPLTLVA